MGGNEVLVEFPSQTRFVYLRLFVSSDGQEIASACGSVGAALQLPSAAGQQGRGAGLGQHWRGLRGHGSWSCRSP